MKSILSALIMAAILLLCALTPVVAQDLKAITPLGCFSSSDPLDDQGSWTFQSSGYCQKVCAGLEKPVMGTAGGSNCWCGDLIPAANSKVADSECNIKCNGYPQENCGGTNTWTVYLTGVDNSVSNVPDTDSSASSSSDTKKSTSISTTSPTSQGVTSQTPDSTTKVPESVIVTHASTIVVTATGNSDAEAPTSTGTKGKGSNTAGIAAGVVVGVVVICAIAGGLFFFLRNRKRRAAEEEFHRNSAHTLVMPSNMSDARLEPSVMMQRRQSDGSIADNRDYSRRILKVTNPDGT